MRQCQGHRLPPSVTLQHCSTSEISDWRHFREGAHLANLNSKAIAVWSGVRTLAPTQIQAGKCERESQETKQAHVPFVVWLEQADHFVTPLPCGGIYDTNVFKGNSKKKKKRKEILKRNNFLSLCPFTWIEVRALIISLAGLIPSMATGFMSIWFKLQLKGPITEIHFQKIIGCVMPACWPVSQL